MTNATVMVSSGTTIEVCHPDRKVFLVLEDDGRDDEGQIVDDELFVIWHAMQRIAELEAERDQLREQNERYRNELEDLSLSGDPKAASEHYWQCADLIEPYVHFGPPPMESGTLPNSVVDSMGILLEAWKEAGRLREQNAALEACVEGLHKEAENAMGIIEARLHDWEGAVEGLEAELNNPTTTSLAQRDAHIAYETISATTFPTMLRKMRSGGEVLAWLENEAEKHRQQAEGGES